MYVIEIEHRGLNKHRAIRGVDRALVMRKAELQHAAWDEQWEAKSARQEARASKEAKTAEAAARTSQAQQTIADLQSILAQTLQVDDAIDWGTLKRRHDHPATPPDEPLKDNFPASIGLLDHLLPFLKRRKFDDCEARYQRAVREWQLDVQEWRSARRQVIEHNAAVDAQRARYFGGDAESIAEYCDLVLSNSSYPDFFPQEFQIDCDTATKTLVVEYRLPALADFPKLMEARYIAARDEFKETHLKDRDINALYDRAIYQVALRTIHELFEADRINAIEAVVFNGWVHYVDPRSGHDTQACIASLQATKREFEQINLAAVDPRECFRALKGVSASKLASMAAVAPILQLNREDKRFISSEEVASRLEHGTNIAAIGWEEFEHLVREIFAAEFTRDGGEVKVTQASRDGGVDAIAFDPDPIRGGKIVIQAKRYTNTVDVAAVRDLYGTVMNEGATKGILVTTSSFGPDAYRFAKDKPLTLLDGSNLLHLLAKHGHNARIDLREAKKLGVALKR